MTAPNIDRMVCGDPLGSDHAAGCALAAAETIAAEAADVGRRTGGNGLLCALAALAEEGMLRDITDADPEDMLLGVLDELWDSGLLGPSARGVRPQLTVVRGEPEAAPPASVCLEMTAPRRQLLAAIDLGRVYRQSHLFVNNAGLGAELAWLVAAGWVRASAPTYRYDLTPAGREALYGAALAGAPLVPHAIQAGGAS